MVKKLLMENSGNGFAIKAKPGFFYFSNNFVVKHITSS